LPTRCINHREKQAKFRVEGDSSGHYCESCAVELNQKGKRLTTIKNEDPSAKMVVEAKQYLRSLEEVMERLGQKRSEVRVEKYKLESRYSGLQEDIEQERRSIIAKINDQYDSEMLKINDALSREAMKLEDEEERLRKI
jgi:hemerythrin-like domain-containing protein